MDASTLLQFQVQCIPWDVARHLHSAYKYRPSSNLSVELKGRHPDRAFDALMAPMRVLPVHTQVAIAERMEQQARAAVSKFRSVS